jgi:hypothetical protein
MTETFADSQSRRSFFLRSRPIRAASDPASLNDEFLQSLKQFVSSGGDLVIYHQHDAINMPLVQKMFGVKYGGTSKGCSIVDEALKAKTTSAGLVDADLRELRFYNRYENIPEIRASF